MTDISMCENSFCRAKRKCHRFTAKPSEHRQSYGGFAPPKGEDRCGYFMDNTEKEKCSKQ